MPSHCTVLVAVGSGSLVPPWAFCPSWTKFAMVQHSYVAVGAHRKRAPQWVFLLFLFCKKFCCIDFVLIWAMHKRESFTAMFLSPLKSHWKGSGVHCKAKTSRLHRLKPSYNYFPLSETPDMPCPRRSSK